MANVTIPLTLNGPSEAVLAIRTGRLSVAIDPPVLVESLISAARSARTYFPNDYVTVVAPDGTREARGLATVLTKAIEVARPAYLLPPPATGPGSDVDPFDHLESRIPLWLAELQQSGPSVGGP